MFQFMCGVCSVITLACVFGAFKVFWLLVAAPGWALAATLCWRAAYADGPKQPDDGAST